MSESFGCRCQHCAGQWDESAPHHRKKKSQGGTGEIKNAAYLCRECHRKCHNPKTDMERFVFSFYNQLSWQSDGDCEQDYLRELANAGKEPWESIVDRLAEEEA